MTAKAGAGRVVVLADSDLFGDDCLDELDHRELWLQPPALGGRFRARLRARRAAARCAGADALADPAWATLRDETNALAALQNADGSLAGDAADGASATSTRSRARSRRPGRPFPPPGEYLLMRAHRPAPVGWRAAWHARTSPPRWTPSAPSASARDGVCHLVFFPMYKQNGPRESVFEALIIRTPWPEFVAELERTRYDNAKFVPVEMLGHTQRL